MIYTLAEIENRELLGWGPVINIANKKVRSKAGSGNYKIVKGKSGRFYKSKKMSAGGRVSDDPLIYNPSDNLKQQGYYTNISKELPEDYWNQETNKLPPNFFEKRDPREGMKELQQEYAGKQKKRSESTNDQKRFVNANTKKQNETIRPLSYEEEGMINNDPAVMQQMEDTVTNEAVDKCLDTYDSGIMGIFKPNLKNWFYQHPDLRVELINTLKSKGIVGNVEVNLRCQEVIGIALGIKSKVDGNEGLFGMSYTTLLLIGGAAIVLILLMSKSTTLIREIKS